MWVLLQDVAFLASVPLLGKLLPQFGFVQLQALAPRVISHFRIEGKERLLS
ncbi:hypothetical protein [Bacillus infantis]|uniref:hypothetical protein n=1 Tax=Bacillus infantis TaxID=324767 RepID=UPI001653A740|nr:hypothetical protein [Bacillus infantis]